jgi:hypothetical protein
LPTSSNWQALGESPLKQFRASFSADWRAEATTSTRRRGFASSMER